MLASTDKFIQIQYCTILPNCTVRAGFYSLLRVYSLTWKKYKAKGIFSVFFLEVLTKSRRIQYLLRMQNIVFPSQNPLMTYLIHCVAYIIYIHTCKACLQIWLLIKILYNTSRWVQWDCTVQPDKRLAITPVLQWGSNLPRVLCLCSLWNEQKPSCYQVFFWH